MLRRALLVLALLTHAAGSPAAEVLAEPAGAATSPEQAALREQLRPLLEKFVTTVDGLSDYSVVMTKQQRIGKDLKPMETLLLKHRRKPECRYMKWLAEPNKDREAILCKERSNGEILVHQTGFMGFTMSLSPTNSLITRGNLRPIAQSGIFNMAAMLRQSAGQGDDAAPPEVKVRSIDGIDTLCVRRNGAPSNDNAPYKVGAAELCFDRATAMPVDVQFWDDAQRLMEHYGFRDMKLNPGLTDLDFDPKNPDYHF